MKTGGANIAPEGGYILSSLRFLSPTRGTEGVVKTIEERLGEKGGAFLKGKEGRVGFRKKLLLAKGDGGIRKSTS